MKYYFCEKYTSLAWVWLLLISVLTVLKIGPDALNADILINSVMSLQNLTLYYWGQNRLLNVLPLVVTLVKNPAYNLAALLFLTSISFYGLLYLLSRSAAMLVGTKNENALSFKVFLIISSVFVFVFSSPGVSEIAIGHIEYSFPSLLLVFACLNLFSGQGDTKDWRRLILPVAAIILAIGLNPSTVIPAFVISMASTFYKKRVRLNEVVLLLASGIAFLIWDVVSRRYGSLPYHEFKLEILHSGLQKVLAGLLGAINLPILLLLIAFISIGRVGYVIYKNTKNVVFRSEISYITSVVILFSVGWLLLFSSSRWVEMNQFAWRYFIYIIFALIFLCALHLYIYFKDLSVKKSLVLTGIAAFSSIIFLGSNVTTLHFNDYKVFQRVNALSEPGVRLYSGDYWVVWPSVLRDMIAGYEAYGLTFRGEANKVAARNFILSLIKEKGSATVYCLNDSVLNCISQVNSVAGPLYALDSKQHKDEVFIIDFAEKSSFLDFKGTDFVSLPSQVGVDNGTEKLTQQRAGFLVYGPNVSVKSGNYLLSVSGSSNRLVGAYVDVVSAKGSTVYAKFDLRQEGDSYLLRNRQVNLAEDVSDLEVRVWVGENDEVNLLGYSLKPFQAGRR